MKFSPGDVSERTPRFKLFVYISCQTMAPSMKYSCFHKLSITIALCALPIFSQSPERIEMETQGYAERLLLTREQTVKVREIIKRHFIITEQEQSNERSHRRDRIKSEIVRIERNDAEIEKLLTAEQKKKFELLKEERRQEMRERMKERQP